MFGKRTGQTENQQSYSIAPSKLVSPRYHHPKILLIDMKDDAETLLKSEGYNVAAGSFGVPYRVQKADQLFPVIINGALPPNFAEQEIFIIDLLPSDPLSQPKGEKHTSPGESDWWGSCSEGMIDPRPRFMEEVKEYLDRIFEHGGVFIIFADRWCRPRVISGYLGRLSFQKERDIYCHNWGFLSILNGLQVKNDYGEEISVVGKASPLGQILSEHTQRARFLCTLHPNESAKWLKAPWLTFAVSKYGATVAGEIALPGGGWILIFPQLRDQPRFLVKILKDVLPDLSPRLFPQVEGAHWVQRPEYELPEVLELRNRICSIQEAAKQEVIKLEKAIEENRAAMSYLYDLIRETGRPLVQAVKQTLETLGFQSVFDADEQIENAGEGGTKREDLQIHDSSPTLLVEVKGISFLPRDSGALQVWKYVAPRMKEWSRTDVQGLAIINHQRNLPALEREHKAPFREDVLTNAQEQQFGLLTTWDLFKLTRSYLKLG
jgi:hypothetical protein